MQHFWKTLHYLRYYKAQALGNIIFNILAALFTIASFLVLKPFLDILFSETTVVSNAAPPTGWIDNLQFYFNQYLSNYILQAGKAAGLVLVAGIVVSTFLLKNLFRYLALYVMSPVRYGVEYRIRQAVFERLLLLPISYFSEERKGDLMARITIDVQEIEWSVLKSLETLVRSPLMIIGSLFVMMYISPLLTGFSFLLIIFVGAIIGGISSTLKRTSTKAQESQGRILSILDEALGGLRVVRAFNASKYQAQIFNQENQHYQETMVRIMRRKDLSSPLTEFLGVAVVVVLLVFGGRLVFQGVFEASTFVVFITMFYNIIDPAKSFSSAYYAVQKGSAAIERINQILEHPMGSTEDVTGITIQTVQEGIEFQNVSFAYQVDQPVLNQINLTLPKGKSIGLVGVSGAGKSTLIDLLPRFYDPSGGQILLDGKPLSDYNIHDLRRLMALVSQEAILFNDTIYNNIAFGWEQASPEAVERAAKLANAHDFILETEQGYQTKIGDRGNKLSGGQRQRITIARALLRDAPILLLDEATSALDASSERLIQEALLEVLKGRTALVIAHRLSTIQHLDHIIVMNEGRIVEEGSHQSLLAQKGTYYQLVQLQSL